jgi:hypothetical protein
MDERSPRNRLSRGLRTAALALCVLPILACGGAASEGEETASGTAAPPAPAAGGVTDPCELVTAAEWIEATGYEDLQTDRSAHDTCDLLSDTLWGVVGSVNITNPNFLEYMRGRADGEAVPVAGLGDEAITSGQGTIVRLGDRVVWAMVNPAVEDHVRISTALARLAVSRL